MFQLSKGDRHNRRKIAGSMYHLYWMCHYKEFFTLSLKSTVRALIFGASFDLLPCFVILWNRLFSFFKLNSKNLSNRTGLVKSLISYYSDLSRIPLKRKLIKVLFIHHFISKTINLMKWSYGLRCLPFVKSCFASRFVTKPFYLMLLFTDL